MSLDRAEWALDLHLSRRVAIKFINGLSDQSIARFKREYKLLAKVSASNIVQIFERGQCDDGTPFIVMECINGRTLEQALSDSSDRPDIEEIITIALQVCTALSHLHKLGLVHRDLKPSNIMLKKDDGVVEAKLMDFGAVHETDIALTGTNELLGSPAYMSPEHLTPKLLDGRSDIFSMGCVLYRCVAERPPFEADSAFQTLLKMQTGTKEVLNTNVPPFLRRIIDRCTMPNPADRFQSAEELHKALTERQCNEPSAPSPRARSLKPVLMALIGVAIVGTSAFIFMRTAPGGNKLSQTELELAVLANQSHWAKFDELASKTITSTNHNAFSETWESFDKAAHHFQQVGDYDKAIKYSDLAVTNCNKISRKAFLELSGIDKRFSSNKSDLQSNQNDYRWLSVNNETKIQSNQQSLMRFKELRARLSERLNLNPLQVKSNFENVLQYAAEQNTDNRSTLGFRQDYARFLVNQRDPARKKVIEDIKNTTLDQLKNNSYLSWLLIIATLNLEFEEASNTEANKIIAEFEPYPPKDIKDRCSFWCEMYRLSLKTDKPRVDFTDYAYAQIGNLAATQQCDVLLLMAHAHPERRMEFTQRADKIATIHQIAPHCRASVHANFAQAYAERKDYQTAVKYVDQAIQEYIAGKVPMQSTTSSHSWNMHLRDLQEEKRLWEEKAKAVR